MPFLEKARIMAQRGEVPNFEAAIRILRSGNKPKAKAKSPPVRVVPAGMWYND
jgi:hypothetical protein